MGDNMKCKIEFDLPSQQEEFNLCMNAHTLQNLVKKARALLTDDEETKESALIKLDKNIESLHAKDLVLKN